MSTGRKDLTIEVEEKRTGSLNFGAGFSTVDSLVGFAEMTSGQLRYHELAQHSPVPDKSFASSFSTAPNEKTLSLP